MCFSSSHQETFEQAAEDVKVLKQRPGYGVLGDVYALYKQATMGDNTLSEYFVKVSNLVEGNKDKDRLFWHE